MQLSKMLSLPPSHLLIMNAVDLQAQLGDIADRCQAIQDAADREHRALTPEESDEFETLAERFKAVEASMQAQQKHADALKYMTRGPGRQTTPDGPAHAGAQSVGFTPYRGALGDSGPVDSAKLRMLQRAPILGRRCLDLFGHAHERNPFPSVDEFLDIIVNNKFDPRLIKAASMSEGVPSEGGYLVPVEYSVAWLDAALELSEAWQRCRVEPMGSREKYVATFDGSDHSAGKQYGVSLQWVPENGSYSEQVAKTRSLHLVAGKAGILVPFSVELGEDAPSFSTLLQTALTGALSWGIDSAIWSGDGAGKPLGILNSAALVSVAKEGGQLADTIEYANIVNMFSRMLPGSMNTSTWFANPTTLPQLLQLSLGSVGNEFYPLLKEETGAFSLLGRPLILTEKLPILGDKGDLVFADMNYYVLGMRRELTVALDPYSKFGSDQIQLKVSTRIAGQPALAAPFTPYNGATQSAFVALDDR